MIYVQHLLGIGHYKRAELLALALDRAGIEVDLITGGMAVVAVGTGNVRIHQLAPLRAADMTFRTLVDGDGQPLDDRFRAARRDSLLALFADIEPDALIVETFPFGRWMMRFELDPLLDAAAARAPRPLIISSIRDVQQERSAERNADTVRRVLEQFDAVLVHGDPDLIPLESSFPEADRIGKKVFYTGYMAATQRRPRPAARREIVVSAGGGAVGMALLQAAIAARPLSAARGQTWRLLAGHNMSETEVDELRAHAAAGTIVERARPDFRRLLAGAAVSVSQAGYNTVMDLLSTETPAIVVPFAGCGETEQSTRARVLAERGRVQIVAESDLTAEHLAAAIDRALAAPPLKPPKVDLSGMPTSARLVKGWLAERP
ncbi:MAG: glycosyl transferase family 28 [Alphaproteobacteria bacterium]|nr:glycosyl transferase family 28 [Alphaproteobacteria bacterium]